MNGYVPDSMLWWRYPCRQCHEPISQVQGHDRLAPNHPRSPKSLCFACRSEQQRILVQRQALRFENNLGHDSERDSIARTLLDQVL